MYKPVLSSIYFKLHEFVVNDTGQLRKNYELIALDTKMKGERQNAF